jgi:hypothetical protein
MSSAGIDPAGRTAAPSPRVPSSPGGPGDGFVTAPPAAAPPPTAPTMRMPP